jgi:hypothetical protein
LTIDFADQIGCRQRDTESYEVDGIRDHTRVAQDSTVAEARGLDELRVWPRSFERDGVVERDLAIVAIMKDEECVVAVCGEALEAQRFDVETGVVADALLERCSIAIVETDDARETIERILDENVWREHHIARSAHGVGEVGDQRSGRAERVRDESVKWTDSFSDIGDRIGHIGEVEAVLRRAAVSWRIERDNGHACRHEWSDERAELGSAPFPSVNE